MALPYLAFPDHRPLLDCPPPSQDQAHHGAPVILYRTYRTSTVLVPTAACFTVTYVLVLPRYSRPLSWG